MEWKKVNKKPTKEGIFKWPVPSGGFGVGNLAKWQAQDFYKDVSEMWELDESPAPSPENILQGEVTEGEAELSFSEWYKSNRTARPIDVWKAAIQSRQSPDKYRECLTELVRIWDKCDEDFASIDNAFAKAKALLNGE